MKKIILIIALLSSFLMLANAQKQGQEKVDSLLIELPKLKNDDTKKVTLLADISYEYSLINPKVGINYAQECLTIANKLNSQNGIARCYNSLGTNNYSLGNFHIAIKYFKKSLKINKKLKNKSSISSNFSNIGSIYLYLSDKDKALDYYRYALKIDRELGDKSSVATNLGNIGSLYADLSDYKKSLDYYFKALRIYEELGDKSGIEINLGNIGIIYHKLSNYDKALVYYFRALKFSEELGDNYSIAINLGNIGIVYLKLSEYDKALNYYNRALELNKVVGNKSAIANNFSNLGDLYTQIGEMDKSAGFLEKALEINVEINDNRQTAITLNNLSGNFLAQALECDTLERNGEITCQVANINKVENHKKALMYGKQAEKIADSINLKELHLEIYYNIYKAHKCLNNTEEALIYFEKYTMRKDSMFSAESRREINQMADKYERERNEHIASIKANKEEEQMRYRNTLEYAGILLLIVILLVTMFIVRNYNIRQDFIEASVFFTFLLFYEFITVLAEPWVDSVTNEEPLYKLGINIAIAFLIIPLSKIEHKLRYRFIGTGKN